MTETYVDWLAIDLSFQDIQTELNNFEREYGPPEGCYLIAMVGERPAGGVGLRKFDTGICEMKRLFVYSEFRGQGIGRRLCELIIKKAALLGYEKMRLDTLERLAQANHLYEKMGFYDIPAYRENPEPGARYMEYTLS